jgi:dimethylamine/trimethylamine dehydrogenase
MYPNTTATRWSDGRLHVCRSDTHAPLAAIAAATLLSVTARLPQDGLKQDLDDRGMAHTVIGDALAPGIIQAAVFSGHRAAREFLDGAAVPFKREVPVLFA